MDVAGGGIDASAGDGLSLAGLGVAVTSFGSVMSLPSFETGGGLSADGVVGGSSISAETSGAGRLSLVAAGWSGVGVEFAVSGCSIFVRSAGLEVAGELTGSGGSGSRISGGEEGTETEVAAAPAWLGLGIGTRARPR